MVQRGGCLPRTHCTGSNLRHPQMVPWSTPGATSECRGRTTPQHRWVWPHTETTTNMILLREPQSRLRCKYFLKSSRGTGMQITWSSLCLTLRKLRVQPPIPAGRAQPSLQNHPHTGKERSVGSASANPEHGTEQLPSKAALPGVAPHGQQTPQSWCLTLHAMPCFHLRVQ